MKGNACPRPFPPASNRARRGGQGGRPGERLPAGLPSIPVKRAFLAIDELLYLKRAALPLFKWKILKTMKSRPTAENPSSSPCQDPKRRVQCFTSPPAPWQRPQLRPGRRRWGGQGPRRSWRASPRSLDRRGFRPASARTGGAPRGASSPGRKSAR